jgi:DNA-binding MarR family transcriptional regulator
MTVPNASTLIRGARPDNEDQERCIVIDVYASELFLLGRKLMKLGEESIPPSPRTRAAGGVSTTIRLVMADISYHPGSSVSEITERTGFPQSLVSLAVAKLRDFGVVVTQPDPTDRRRTLVRPVESVVRKGGTQHTAVRVDETIAKAIGAEAQDRLPEVLAALELLGQLMIPEVYGLGPEPANAT